MKTLEEWLAHCGELHPKGIDLGLDRVRAVAERMGLALQCPVFTVAGTNGKGSTCAMLEAILQAAGYRTGLYTSPHLIRFEERCRIDGKEITPEGLIGHFEHVERARGDTTLTYFEFTTLAILEAFAEARLDAVVLEVGMGGRFDAVNIIDADCALIASIDIDHAEFLGDTRDKIGFEQAGIFRPGRPAIVADPLPPQSVIDHAREIGADLWRHGHDFNFQGDRLQWNWAGRGRRYSGLGYPALPGANQLLNAAGALAALSAMRQVLPVSAQAVRSGLGLLELRGRFQVVEGQPLLILDVAHNPHAAAALAFNLNSMGFFHATHAVFGAMADKDIASILKKIEPHVDHWYFTDLPTPRAAKASDLQAIWKAQTRRPNMSAELFANPYDALLAAARRSEATDRIICFGSFYTVGGVLEHGTPELHPGARPAPNVHMSKD